MGDVFEVTFGCRNCGASFSDTYPPETTVDRDRQSMVTARNGNCDSMSLRECDCCSLVSCPVCEKLRDVRIDDRQPLDEEYQ